MIKRFKQYRNLIFLIVIIIVATFLRFYQLGINPPSLTWDETAWGYNAYSLGIDGKDEFGRFLPYDYLESFGDFKPPVYAYLDIIPVKLFGLNEFATRFPSAFFGVLTVLITYFLTKRLSKNSPYETLYALIAAGILAISPWYINLSRAAFEANVSSFFIISGIWLFLAGVQGKKWYLVLSAVMFVISLYTFNTARVVSPLLVIALASGFRKELWVRKKEAVIAAIVGLLLIAPIVKFLLSPQASLRFQEVNIFSDPKVVERVNDEIAYDNNAWWSKIIHNRRFSYTFEFLHHYFDNLRPDFLFITGDGNPKFSTQDIGQMYLWDLPFFVIGIIFLFRKREKNWWIIPVWLLLAIIPAATARETPHALRIETTLPTFQILTAVGVSTAILFLKNKKWRFLLTPGISIVVFLILCFNFLYYIHGYYTHYKTEYSGEWQYGYKDSIAYVKDNQKQYDEVWITDELGRPYIYYLFYLQIPPTVFRQQVDVKRDAFGFVHINAVGKYKFFGDMDYSHVSNKKILFVDVARKVPHTAHVLKTFYLLNGEPELVAYTI